jgi:arylsulfatase A-like enzyme
MKLKKFIYLSFFLPLALLAFSNCNNTSKTKTEKIPVVSLSKPNIIILFADDLGYADLGCQGSTDIITPNIDKMADDGVRFTSGYCTAPQCGPSRAGLISGLNQARFGYLDNKNNHGLPGKEIAPTIADYMKQQGYSTGIIGKWHLGDEPEFADDIVEKSRPWNNGFDYVLMHNRGMSHYYPYRTDGIEWMTSRDREPKLTEVKENNRKITLKDYPENAYITDIFSDESVNFIKRHKKEPFFLYVAYNAPHTPLVAKEEDIEANSHITDVQRRRFAAMMTALDRGVGNIRQALEDNGITENTLIYFVSDNGGPTSKNTSKNTPLSGFKGDVLEGGIRVPFIACWPGVIPKKQEKDFPVSTFDILPTAVALSGGELKANLTYPGVNIIPYINGKKEDVPHKEIIWRWRNKTAIRQGDFKLVEPSAKLPHSGLYNLKENLKEIPETKVNNDKMETQLQQKLENWNTKMVDKL